MQELKLPKHFDQISQESFNDMHEKAQGFLVRSTAEAVKAGDCPACWLRLMEMLASEMADMHDGGKPN